jgi:two-component system, NtrC family, response regulator AtoC
MKPRVAVIDDLEQARMMMSRTLSRSCEVLLYAGVAEALAAFEADPPDVILTDLRMPGIDGLQGLKIFREKGIDAPVIIVTAYASVETAVDAMRAGAFEYVQKPIDPDKLELLVERAAEHTGLKRENVRLKKELDQRTSVQGIVGRSPQLKQVLQLLERVAPTDVPVLIQGESGTGKDLVARAVHALSKRAHGPYVSLNMSAIPDQLAESELFGHEKGAFSGATSAQRGFFAEAAGGTFFLDEIGALSPQLQPKLLRVLQDGDFIPVGSRQARKADVRIVCATNEDLEGKVKKGLFREDLYYRLKVFPVRLPPLRERREDIPMLVHHFVQKHAGALGRPALPVEPEALKALLEHKWPGNIRELEHTVERALLLAPGSTLRLADLPPELQQPQEGGEASGYRFAREQWEQKYLSELLRDAGGSVAKAAEAAGLHRSTFYEKLARHHLVPEE